MNSLKYYKIARIILGLIFLILVPFLILNFFAWNLLNKIYILSALFFLLYRFAAWFYADFNPQKDYGLSDEPYTIIIPVKDEEPSLFIKAVEMAVAQQGKKEVFIGDDGSSIPVENLLRQHPELYKKVRIFRSEKNIGKKHIQVRLMKQAKYDVIVEIDSDSVLENTTTVARLIAPLQDKKVGIANGCIGLYSKGSILNRIQLVMYYGGNNVGRKSWGNLGLNPVASGAILAIRKSYFVPFVNEYLNKKFLGKEICYGEDRLMTNIFLREGYNSVYVEKAKAKTVDCETLTKFTKQQIRWCQSGVRESLFLLGFSKNVYLSTLVLFNLILPFVFTILFLTSLISSLLVGYWWHIPIIIGTLVIATFISNVPLVIENYRRFPDLIFFALCNVLLLSPLWFYALFTLNKTGWGTR